MSPQDVEVSLGRLAAAVPEALDRDGCNARLRDLSRLKSWLAADELRTARQLRALAAEGKAEPVEAVSVFSPAFDGKDRLFVDE